MDHSSAKLIESYISLLCKLVLGPNRTYDCGHGSPANATVRIFGYLTLSKVASIDGVAMTVST